MPVRRAEVFRIQKIRIHKAGKKHTEQKGCRKSIGLASFNTHEWYEFPKYAFCCRERLDRCTLPVRSGTKPWAGEAVSQSSFVCLAAKVSHASVMPQQWISQKPRKCFPIFCPTAFAPFLQKVQVRGGRMINLASFSVQTPLKTVGALSCIMNAAQKAGSGRCSEQGKAFCQFAYAIVMLFQCLPSGFRKG